LGFWNRIPGGIPPWIPGGSQVEKLKSQVGVIGSQVGPGLESNKSRPGVMGSSQVGPGLESYKSRLAVGVGGSSQVGPKLENYGLGFKGLQDMNFNTQSIKRKHF